MDKSAQDLKTAVLQTKCTIAQNFNQLISNPGYSSFIEEEKIVQDVAEILLIGNASKSYLNSPGMRVLQKVAEGYDYKSSKYSPIVYDIIRLANRLRGENIMQGNALEKILNDIQKEA